MVRDRLRDGLGSSSFGHDNLCNQFSLSWLGKKKGNGSDCDSGIISLMNTDSYI